MPALILALADKRLNRLVLVERAALVLLEKEKLDNKLRETLKGWEDCKAALFNTQMELSRTKIKLKDKTFEDLLTTDRLTVPLAFSKYKRACLLINLYLEAHIYLFSRLHTTPSPSITVCFERDEVREAIGKLPTSPQCWEEFLDMNENIRKRMERQTSWRKGEIEVEIMRLSTTMSDPDQRKKHAPQDQDDKDDGLVISECYFTREECLGIAALLFDYIPIEFDRTSDLMDEFKRNELVAKRKEQNYEGWAEK